MYKFWHITSCLKGIGMTQLAPIDCQLHAEYLLQHYNLKILLEDLEARGARAYFVGGTARDLVLSAPVRDIDIEIFGLEPEKLLAILQRHAPVQFVGKTYGVYRLVHMPVEFSIPRNDGQGRKPKVEINPFMPIELALTRRDLTINAFAYDLIHNKFIDPFNGIKDLEDRVLRAPVLERFAEDPLRFWRLFQFVARFNAQVEEHLSTLCATMDLTGLARERVEQEIVKWALYGQDLESSVVWLQSIGRSDLLEISESRLSREVFMRASELLYATVHEKLVLRSALLTLFSENGRTLKKIFNNTAVIAGAKLLSELGKNLPSDQMFTQLQLHSSALTRAHLSPYTYAQYCYAHTGSYSFFELLQHRRKLFSFIEPLVRASDIEHRAQGPLLGKMLHQAYFLQLTEPALSKQDLINYVIADKK